MHDSCPSSCKCSWPSKKPHRSSLPRGKWQSSREISYVAAADAARAGGWWPWTAEPPESHSRPALVPQEHCSTAWPVPAAGSSCPPASCHLHSNPSLAALRTTAAGPSSRTHRCPLLSPPLLNFTAKALAQGKSSGLQGDHWIILQITCLSPWAISCSICAYPWGRTTPAAAGWAPWQAQSASPGPDDRSDEKISDIFVRAHAYGNVLVSFVKGHIQRTFAEGFLQNFFCKHHLPLPG